MLATSFACTGAADDIVAGATGKRVRVHKIRWVTDGTGLVEIHFGTSAAGTRLVYETGVAGTHGVLDFGPGGINLGASGDALQGTTSAGNVRGTVFYSVYDG